MQHDKPLLALESNARNVLLRMLTRLHYNVVVTDSVPHALSKVQRLDLAAAVVLSRGDIDPLEFTLSAHDIDDTLPVVVVCSTKDERMVDVLCRQQGVKVVDEGAEDLSAKLDASLQEVMS